MKSVFVLTFCPRFLLGRYDYVRITDGNSNTIGTYCGNQTGKTVHVVGTVAVLIFHSDGSVQSRGFEISFSFFPISPGEFNALYQ